MNEVLVAKVLGIVVFVTFSVLYRMLSSKLAKANARLAVLEGTRVVHEVYSEGPVIKAITGTLGDIARVSAEQVEQRKMADKLAVFSSKTGEVAP